MHVLIISTILFIAHRIEARPGKPLGSKGAIASGAPSPASGPFEETAGREANLTNEPNVDENALYHKFQKMMQLWPILRLCRDLTSCKRTQQTTGNWGKLKSQSIF
jgi:hypothetical protein